jgi:hypothetical protein
LTTRVLLCDPFLGRPFRPVLREVAAGAEAHERWIGGLGRTGGTGRAAQPQKAHASGQRTE